MLIFSCTEKSTTSMVYQWNFLFSNKTANVLCIITYIINTKFLFNHHTLTYIHKHTPNFMITIFLFQAVNNNKTKQKKTIEFLFQLFTPISFTQTQIHTFFSTFTLSMSLPPFSFYLSISLCLSVSQFFLYALFLNQKKN